MSNNIKLVTAEMGLGHIRALKPLQEHFRSKMLILGQTNTSKPRTNKMWRFALGVYSWFSRANDIPLIGRFIFSILDKLLHIKPFTEGQRQSKPTFQNSLINWAIKLGACNDLRENGLKESTIITSFYLPVSYYAKNNNIAQVYCQICDTDLNRAWVPSKNNSRIHYLATTRKSVARLKSYGVNEPNIHLTGFPLPHELVGGINHEKATENYTKRLNYLKNGFRTQNLPLKVVYAIGGAGAMVSFAEKIARSLSMLIINGKVEFSIITAPQSRITERLIDFQKKYLGKSNGFRLVTSESFDDYFSKFNAEMANVHVLWTKPSELSFYSGLGIPIIMCPPLGSQEVANREWLLANRIGADQFNLWNTDIWLMNMLQSQTLARMAKSGWACGKRSALYDIEKIINSDR